MSGNTPNKMPLWALILDGVGTLFFAAGLVGLFAGAPFLSSLPIDLGKMAVVLIILGVLLMVPLIVVLIQRAVAVK